MRYIPLRPSNRLLYPICMNSFFFYFNFNQICTTAVSHNSLFPFFWVIFFLLLLFLIFASYTNIFSRISLHLYQLRHFKLNFYPLFFSMQNHRINTISVLLEKVFELNTKIGRTLQFHWHLNSFLVLFGGTAYDKTDCRFVTLLV